MRESASPTIIRSYARRYSVEELDEAISELSEAFITSSFSSINVLGSSVSLSRNDTETLLETIEAARAMRLETESPETVPVNLDAVSPLGIGFDFSSRRIE